MALNTCICFKRDHQGIELLLYSNYIYKLLSLHNVLYFKIQIYSSWFFQDWNSHIKELINLYKSLLNIMTFWKIFTI